LNVYADSSFFVSLYLQDIHAAQVRGLANLKPAIWLTPLHAAEFYHAVAQQVFFGKISSAEADRVYDNWKRDRAIGVWVEGPLPERAFDLCADLAQRYGPKLGVRTLDSLHVACALDLKAERFWTFDERQLKLARAEGLRTA